MKLWIKTSKIVKWLFPKYRWDFNAHGKQVWLTFDDGPIPEVTPWVLDQLEKYQAKATFFCIGDNVRKHPDVLKQVLDGGHSVGNHTFNHLNGWNTDTEVYLRNVQQCDEALRAAVSYAPAMRPPYGRIRRKQAAALRKQGYAIIMWDVVSADFDSSISPEACLQNVLKNLEPGSIIVFHDSVKAFTNLKYALPKTLEFLSHNGYQCVIPD